MARQYRIVKETKELTKDIKYYIEKERHFLKWKWWSKLKKYVPGYDIELTLDFKTYKEAKLRLDKIVQGTTKEVCQKPYRTNIHDETTSPIPVMKEIPIKLFEELRFLGIVDETGIRGGNGGESNYSAKTIQPWAIWLDYPELTSWDHDIIKRVLRSKKSDPRKLDYGKIIHICQERIRQIETKE